MNNPPRLNIFVPVGEEVLAVPRESLKEGSYYVEFYVNGTGKAQLYDEKVFDLVKESGVWKFKSATDKGGLIGNLVAEGMVFLASYGIKTYKGFYLHEIVGTVARFYKYEVSVSTKQYIEDIVNKPIRTPVYLRGYTVPSSTGIMGYVKKDVDDVYFDKDNAEKLLKAGFGFSSVSFDGNNAVCKIKNPSCKHKNYRGEEEIKVPLTDTRFVTLSNIKAHARRGIEETSKVSALTWNSGNKAVLELKAPINNLRGRIGRFYDKKDGGYGGDYTQGNLHLYLNQNNDHHLNGTLSENFYKDFDYGRAVVFNGLYNKTYIPDSDVKVVGYAANTRNELRREPYEYEKYVRNRDIKSKLATAIGVGLGAAGLVGATGVAGGIITVLGMMDAIGFTSKTLDAIAEVKDPTDAYLMAFAEANEDSAYYVDEGIITSASLEVYGEWGVRVVYVKNKCANTWVPAVCTYNLKAVVDLSYKITHYDAELSDIKRQSIYKEIIYMSPHFRKSGWETEQAKIVYSQFDGRYIFWDHEESPAREVKVLPGFIDENHEGMTLRNFEYTDNFKFENV